MKATKSDVSIDAVSPMQERILLELRSLGIQLEAEIWTLPTYGRHVVPLHLTWPRFCEKFVRFGDARGDVSGTLRWLAACWLTGCGGEVRPKLPATVMNRLRGVRAILLSLLAERKQTLDTVTPRQVQTAFEVVYFDAGGSCIVTRTTLRMVIWALRDLYRLHAYLPSAFAVDPFPPAYIRSVCARGERCEPWTAPPEPVCLELIRRAIRLLGPPADDLIRLRNKYISACEAAKKTQMSRWQVSEAARAVLRDERFSNIPGEQGPWTKLSAQDPNVVKFLATALEGACAVILLFLSGPRVSEPLRAAPGCLKYFRHTNGVKYPYFVAERSKQWTAFKDLRLSEFARDASDRGWIQGEAGVRALHVLDALSGPLRVLSGRRSYWLTVSSSGLWTLGRKTAITFLSSMKLNQRLNIFARLSELTKRTGWSGRLHSHMGRKACVRFVAKRDRTALADLAPQCGHLSPDITDAGYARPDSEFRRLLDEELCGEMQEVARDLAALDLDHTYSCVGRDVVATIQERAARFVGELRSLADVRRLLGRGVRLLPCDWGMCVYREETSACKGSRFGPSDQRRCPSVCKKCMNFLATEKHRPFWQRRADDCKAALALRGLAEQSVKLIRLRLAEATEVLAAISGGSSAGG